MRTLVSRVLIVCLAAPVLLTGCDEDSTSTTMTLDPNGCPYALELAGTTTGYNTGSTDYRGTAICIYNPDGTVRPSAALDEERRIIDNNMLNIKSSGGKYKH